ncbi:MAG: GWxTD domain-containing protein [Bacteroidetes bacterium]|nr:GWxTD domain-containing protein [Bacteroidota bacterium]
MTARPFRFLWTILISLPIFTAGLFPQPNTMVNREQTAGSPVLYEHHLVRTDSATLVTIAFRARYDFFVFVRPEGPSSLPFTAGGEVSVEMLDRSGVSVSRTIRRIELQSQRNAQADLRTQYHQDLLTLPLAPGQYTIVFSLEDKESKRTFTESRRTVTIPPADSAFRSLIPVQEQSDGTFMLFNLGGDVHFSKDHAFLFQSDKAYPSARFTLVKTAPDEDENETIAADSVIQLRTVTGSSLRFQLQQNGIRVLPENTGIGTLLLVSFSGAQLRQGRYELTLTFPDSTVRKSSFGARWLDMPFSLNDLDLAVEPLQFIMTKKEYSEVRRGSRSNRIRNFEAFWRKKDATPATAYNEVMHEFYRRVDVAFTTFRTLKEMNGAVTDRGRIYVMYGPPAATERLLSPDGAPKEIWNYPSLNKVFTFEDPARQGNYQLIDRP